MILLLAATGVVLPLAAQQSLGEVARKNRSAGTARPVPNKVITNEDLGEPAQGRPEVTANAKVDAATEAATKDGKEDGKDKADEGAAAAAEKTPQEQLAAWKQRVSEQKQKVDLLQREYNVALRENQIQNAEYYADAGTRLRNTQQWTEQQAKLRTEMDAKQKALGAEKQKLADLIEEARKAGIPSSQLE